MKIGFVFALLLGCFGAKHYEKFFEVDGGSKYMYYYSDLMIGTPGKRQSVIIDTGSDTMAFPCDHCRANDCGSHQFSAFKSRESRTFNSKLKCPHPIKFDGLSVCEFVKSYAEGSSLLGFLGEDYVKFDNAKIVEDKRLNVLNSNLKKDIRLKSVFGCTTKETGLFKTQYADGILGLDDASTFIKSIEQDNSRIAQKVFSFGLCFHETGGIMSVDLRNKFGEDSKIAMLNSRINPNTRHITVDYDPGMNYYEVPVNRFIFHDKELDLPPVSMMIDSGTTFTHFPSSHFAEILRALNAYCSFHTDKCGHIGSGTFKHDSCLELRQPDEHYANEEQLLASFPDIKFYMPRNEQPYVLSPKNYFYKEYNEDPSERHVSRFCLAIKGDEERKIILGAFSMIDHYFYFDRKEKNIKIFRENCYLRTKDLLVRKTDRILAEEFEPKIEEESGFRSYLSGGFILIMSLTGLGIWKFIISKRKKVRTPLRLID